MKKLFTLLSLLPFSVAFGQAITITATDMPIPTGSYNIMDMSNTGTPVNPIPGTNITWNYGAYNGTGYTEDYITETDTFFTNAGVDVNYPTGKGLAPNFDYMITDEIDFNSSNVKVSGIMVPAQNYDLSGVTGTAGDGLDFPLQKYMLTTTSQIVPFPMTMSSAWHSVSRRVTNFTMNISPLYTNAASQHVYYSHRDDTVVGWGKMRVYAVSGPSIYYDVLMDKVLEYTVDSLYISGAPADATFLSSFGMSQGQHNDSDCYYNYYRKGSFNYLFTFDYALDPTYTTIDQAFSNTDNIMPSGINSISTAAYTTLLYPNPVTGNEVNFKVTGSNVNMAAYTITDITGKVVLSGSIDKGTTLLHLPLAGSLQNGLYVLTVADDKQAIVAREEFTVTAQ